MLATLQGLVVTQGEEILVIALLSLTEKPLWGHWGQKPCTKDQLSPVPLIRLALRALTHLSCPTVGC